MRLVEAIQEALDDLNRDNGYGGSACGVCSGHSPLRDGHSRNCLNGLPGRVQALIDDADDSDPMSDRVDRDARWLAMASDDSRWTLDRTQWRMHFKAAVPTLIAERDAARRASAGLMETQHITPTCRTNRTSDGAWDEAVRRLREIYDAQVAHDPTLTIGLSIARETGRNDG